MANPEICAQTQGSTYRQLIHFLNTRVGEAKKARPPIDHETQIHSLEVISVTFTATPKLLEIHVRWIL